MEQNLNKIPEYKIPVVTLSELKEHPDLTNPDSWTYYNEGNNNIILRYIG